MSKNILAADFSKNPQLLSLESQILTQYQSLAVKLNTLSDEIRQLTVSNEASGDDNGNATDLANNLRGLESKIGLVYTLFKGAVYSLFLQGQEAANAYENREDEEEEPVLSLLSP